MTTSIVVGGQYGSEGKGKLAYHLAKESKKPIVGVRVGGPNSGHTICAYKHLVLRQLPVSVVIDNSIAIIPAGSYINMSVLIQELVTLNDCNFRLYINPNAVVINDSNIHIENNVLKIGESIGSTCQGVGSSIIDRVMRNGNALLAKDVPSLSGLIADTTKILNDSYCTHDIIIEGTQGFGLSLLHCSSYPFVTGRDTTASSVASEAGISPKMVDNIWLVIRSFPIRVGGNSGPLKDEITWDMVSSMGGFKKKFIETTSVTGRLRRVGLFDPFLVMEAIAYNAPTHIVLNHVDYVDSSMTDEYCPTGKMFDFVECVEGSINRKIDLIGTSSSAFINRKLPICKTGTLDG